MIFLDKCNTKVVNAGSGLDLTGTGLDIKCFVPVNGGAIIKAESNLGDAHAVGGVYTNAGFSRLQGEHVYGSYSKLEVTSGTVYVYYSQKYETL